MIDDHVLTTANLELRAASPGSSEQFLQTIDHEVRHWQGYDDAAVAAYGEALLRLDEDAGVPSGCAVWFFVWERNSESLVGQYLIDFTNRFHAMPTLGWWLGRRARGRGYGRESLPVVVEYAHKHLGVPAVAMGTTETNVRAIRQIQSAGARHSKSVSHRLPDGSVVPSRWYVHR